MATSVSDFILTSLRGGLNNSDPAIAIPNDQCVAALNVEWITSMLGERRRGTSAITLPASLSGKDRITWIHRHVPGTDETAAEFWALGVTGTTTMQVARKTTTWADVTMSDTATLTGFSQYQWCAVSLHGKLFIAFDSDVDRLHCVDAGSTVMRRVGHKAPAAPTGADDGGAGTFSGVRYYRVRYTTKSGSITVRRSEPGPVLTFTPNGNDTGITVTKPASISESETHWELEASLNNVDFYIIATTIVATTTATDTTDVTAGYAQTYTLSEDIEDYSLWPSVRFLIADEDRLVGAGSWEDSALSSRVMWSPVFNASGVGNDERLELDTDPSVDLDGLDGGPITGFVSASAGEIWVFKFSRIYKLVRSGGRTKAYDVVCMTKARGALHGSAIAGVDQMGRPCVYFLDPNVGACRAGAGGIKQCGADIRTTWELKNLEATKVACSGLYYPAARQVIWNVATSSANVPNLSIVLQTNETRDSDDGIRRGWTTWNGTRSSALAMCLFATNIETGAARNQTLVPFIGTEGLSLLHRTDTGSTDNGTAYAASILTKPYVLKTIIHHFGVMQAALLAKAVTGAMISMKVIRDFGLETTSTVTGTTFDASAAGETDVIKKLDALKGAELRTAQFQFYDTTPAGTRFELNQLALIQTPMGGN